ncbi:MAG: ROK family protein [Arachnia sp.]
MQRDEAQELPQAYGRPTGLVSSRTPHPNLSMRDIRLTNLRLTLDFVLANGQSVDSSTVAKATQVSRPTAGQNLSNLEGAGLLTRTSARPTHGHGRSLVVYSPNNGIFQILILRVGHGTVEAELLDITGNHLHSDSSALDSPASVVSTLAALTQRVLALTSARILSAILVVMGIVRDGVILLSTRHPSLVGVQRLLAVTKLILEHSPGVEFIIENDARLAAVRLYEFAKSANLPHTSLLAIHMAESPGAGIVFKGQVMVGGHGAAGELSYDPAGHWRRAEKLLGSAARDRGIRSVEVFELAAAGDQWATCVYEEVCNALAAGIESAVVALDPDLVLAAGAIVTAGDHLANVISHRLSKVSLRPPMVLVAAGEERAVMSGAKIVADNKARTRLCLNILDPKAHPLAN